MNKRVVIALVAVLSLGAIWWTYAWAATCIQYRTIGGSSMCTAWKTGTVTVDVTFKDDGCFVPGEGGGEFSVCSAQAEAQTTDSIAFCGNPLNPTRVACNAFVTFNGFASPGDCEGKHDQDQSGEGGLGHRHHGCTATVPLVPDLTACQTCCANAPGGDKGACVDVTPVEMDTRVTAFVGFSEVPVVTMEEHCSINPKKIGYHDVKSYQCNLTCVNEDCVPED